MKVNATVVLTFILLVMMFGAGLVSASWGLALGREALKGITQPDVRPNSNLGDDRGRTVRREGMPFLKEQDIIKRVKERTEGKQQEPKPDEQSSAGDNQKTVANVTPGLPVTSKDRGVTMEVRSAKNSGASLMLNVDMKNEGNRSVRFLYSFLNVTDNQGRALSATTEGLPGELPPNGQTFSGTVMIPMALLDKAEKLSLTLTDYPEQQLQLKMSGIPVLR